MHGNGNYRKVNYLCKNIFFIFILYFLILEVKFDLDMLVLLIESQY